MGRGDGDSGELVLVCDLSDDKSRWGEKDR